MQYWIVGILAEDQWMSNLVLIQEECVSNKTYLLPLQFISNLSLFKQPDIHTTECPQSKQVTNQSALRSSWLCKEGGRLNWQAEPTLQSACPEQNIAHSHRQDNPTSSVHGAVASTLRFCLRLPHLCSSVSVASTVKSGTVRVGLRRAPPLLPPVPAILERPAIGGNRCQLLGKGVV